MCCDMVKIGVVEQLYDFIGKVDFNCEVAVRIAGTSWVDKGQGFQRREFAILEMGQG